MKRGNMSSLVDCVKEIIANQLHESIDRITLNTKIVEDLKADSLDAVMLIMAFEEEFNIQIKEKDAEGMQTVGDIVTYIKKQLLS